MSTPVDVERLFVQDWCEDGSEAYCIACDCIEPENHNGHEGDCPIHAVYALAAENARLRGLVEDFLGALDSNADPERCGLSEEQWEKLLTRARAGEGKESK